MLHLFSLTTDGHLITKRFVSNAVLFYTNHLLPSLQKQKNKPMNQQIKLQKQNQHLNLLKS